MSIDSPKLCRIDRMALPRQFPTHLHSAGFWESLGRTIATFGFLEEILGRAIFAFTATKQYNDTRELEQAYAAWLPKLEGALIDSLGGLIDGYGKAVREYAENAVQGLDELLGLLREASMLRNILCHGSWQPPDSNGASVPFFVNRSKEIFETPVDRAFLDQVQSHCQELICSVVESITALGWQFPGSAGPGNEIWSSSQ